MTETQQPQTTKAKTRAKAKTPAATETKAKPKAPKTKKTEKTTEPTKTQAKEPTIKKPEKVEKEKYKSLVAVKIRGTISAQREARETIEVLRLTHTNHAVLLDSRPAYKGMLKRVQSYVTWGEPTKETVALLLAERGKLCGGKPMTDEYAQTVGYKTLAELAGAIVDCKVEPWKLQGIQPLFKLRPPKKGFKGKTKKSFGAGGEAGYRGAAINELIKRMV